LLFFFCCFDFQLRKCWLLVCLFVQVFGNVYQVFASVKWYAEGGCAQWWMALQITEELEIMRKMVSSACGGTPLDRETVFDRKEALTGVDVQAALRGHGVGSNLSVENTFPFIWPLLRRMNMHAYMFAFSILDETDAAGDLRADRRHLQQCQVGHR
jgi:hypothetical protein